ncbi:DUF2507 domain-containing protein [Alteribacillus iranensis]|uniref:DUF2507 domain-containing protein n=1 Tax=Alteribacillus iranensis TaxID=930128 RepID=A0A1I2CLN8_9BACI|nr:DUF2507 domain-containing protein [Alteribacillus iranensis]SFE69247.1 Protein of unknown function [Alteribacillus iranensis]
MDYTGNEESDFGYKLLRYTLLPELFGSEEDDILYWGGKTIARKYPLEKLDDIVTFFKKAGWGELRLVNEKKRSIYLEMKIEKSNQISRHLEAGYIAEQIEQIKGRPAVTYISREKNKVTFHVQWDK